MSGSKKLHVQTEDRLMELRGVLLDDYELGPLDREDLAELVVQEIGRRQDEKQAPAKAQEAA